MTSSVLDRRARNKAVIHQFYEAVNTQHRERFADLVHPDFVNHGGASGDISGPEALVASLDPFFAAMPDWTVSEDIVIAEGDLVASRGTVTGTSQGPFMGIPPNGKALGWTGMIIYRLTDDGRVIERWQDFDALSMLRQMGVVPAQPGVEVSAAVPRVVQPGPADEANTSAVVRRFVEAMRTGDITTLIEVVAPDFLDHDPMPGQAPGAQGLAETGMAMAGAFPDLDLEVLHVVAEGDLALVRLRYTGTHQGELQGIPATGVHATWTGSNIYRVSGGQVTEGWANLDLISLLQQLGVVPAPEH